MAGAATTLAAATPAVVRAAACTGTTPACAPTWAMPRRNGSCSRNDNGPIVQISRGSDTSRKARTYAGSNCEPAHATISARAALVDIAFLYVRAAVIVSNESTRHTIRPAREISYSLRPCG